MSKRKIGIIVGVVVLVLIGISSLLNDAEPTYNSTIAIRGNIQDEVSVTGRVQAKSRVDLAFEKTGKVTGVFANVGDFKQRGSILVQQEDGDLRAQLAQAEAKVKIEEANLREFLIGSREEEIEVGRVKVSNATIALRDAETGLKDALLDAFTKSDDAVRNKVDQFISNPQSFSPQIDFDIANNQLESDIEQGRVQVEETLNSWNALFIDASSGESLIYTLQIVESNIHKIRFFLENAALAVNTVSSSATLTKATIDGYKADVSTARTNVNSAIGALSTEEEKMKAAESALSLSIQELALIEADTTIEQINAQEAKVEEAKASVQNYEAIIKKTVLIAPISGVVTKQDAKVGEILSGGDVVVSLISASDLEIKADVPEADIAKLKIGNNAEVTLDAYDDDVIFKARVLEIEPAETIIEGIATYKTTLEFVNEDSRIKSGMTANIDVKTGSRENVIVIPSRAVVRYDGQKIVRVVNGSEYDEIVVETGLKGIDGNIEIINGINEGDEVIIFLTDE